MQKIKTILLSSTLLLIISLNANAQKLIEGIVIDSITHAPIGYVNIGILGNTNGTVSNDDGQYSLQLKASDKTIQFSSIGFYNKTFTIENWEKSDTVYLTPRAYDLNNIEVSSKEFNEEKTLGTIVKGKNTNLAWGKSDYLGVEIGIPIKIKKETLLKSAHFSVHSSANKSLLLRLNIYEFKNKKVGENLLTENIFVQSKDLVDYGKIDLSHLNLIVDDDVLVALETIEKKDVQEEFYLSFRVKMRKKTNILYRDASQAKFKKGLKGGAIPFMQIGCYLEVKQ